tara:strand:+ start:17241 stop:19268 length:2028 start_codon:yes stop_codon:yes gene_type:complete
VNLVFPVAGEGSRFGGVFKPFMKIGDTTFIEVTYRPFKKWQDNIESVTFICTEEQDTEFSVEEKLKNIIDHPNVRVIKLKNKTKGPYETIKSANLSGACIICDCDHSLNVDPIFKKLDTNPDCIIPVWKFKDDEYQNWSKVVCDGDNIKMICEKEKIESEHFDVRGIIGCIYFKDISCFSGDGIYVSDCLSSMLKESRVMKTVDIDQAYFYGDPDMLENHVNYLRKRCTIFCDIDGTLVKHEPHSDANLNTNVTLSGIDELSKWKKNGHQVILTTARSEKTRTETVNMLCHFGIDYDQLVMGLPSGPRVVINDRKPSKLFTPQAVGAEITRDGGVSGIDIDEYTKHSDLEVVDVLKGNSFATTYLIRDGESFFVRKQVIKSDENIIHYEKIKRQVEDLKRLGFMWEGSTPNILRTQDNQYDFYYDMEYLDGYTPLAELNKSPQTIFSIANLIENMNESVYSFKREVEGLSWLRRHLNIKIYPKLKIYEQDSELDPFINRDEVFINNKPYYGLREVLSRIDLKLLKPKHLRPIHGDFTLENVMISKSGDLKLIDMDSSDYVDAAELDLGKMCQSIMSRYSEWKDRENLFTDMSINNTVCVNEYFDYDDYFVDSILEQWSKVLTDDPQTTKMKGAFYMSMYFIRFIPFRMQVSREHGLFALLMSIVWLNKVLEEQGK